MPAARSLLDMYAYVAGQQLPGNLCQPALNVISEVAHEFIGSSFPLFPSYGQRDSAAITRSDLKIRLLRCRGINRRLGQGEEEEKQEEDEEKEEEEEEGKRWRCWAFDEDGFRLGCQRRNIVGDVTEIFKWLQLEAGSAAAALTQLK
ncbi:hypothetical protein KM043_012767 [Ampulex compressa]|nr:hypothetical protein KM043_012767 [Ampulex compressa]